MTPNCHRHGWEIADGVCGDCGRVLRQLPVRGEAFDGRMCVRTLAAAGVRRNRQPKMGRRQRRAIVAEQRRAHEDLVAAATATEPGAAEQTRSSPNG